MVVVVVVVPSTGPGRRNLWDQLGWARIQHGLGPHHHGQISVPNNEGGCLLFEEILPFELDFLG